MKATTAKKKMPKRTLSSTQSRSSSRPNKSPGAKKAASNKSRHTNGKGIVSTVVSTVTGFFGSGQTNAIDLLEKDHDTVETLFEQVKENEDGNNVERFKQIKEELDTHTHIEEEIFYPYLFQKGDDDLKRMVREAFEEHAQARDLLRELASIMRDTPDFNAKLKVLRENIEHHVAEEEDEMFPMVENQISRDTLQKLGAELQAEKERFKRGDTERPVTQQRSAKAR
jgi:hemerythrin-like domain-containing protein